MNYYSATCALIIFGVGSLIYFSDYYKLTYFSICPQCATIKNGQDIQYPFAKITYFNSAGTTPLNKLLTKHKLIEEHQHQWLFVRGYGKFVRGAIGDGYKPYERAHSPTILSFISHWIKRDKVKAKLWAKIVLHPDTFAINSYLLPFYKNNITNEEFTRWQKKWLDKEHRDFTLETYNKEIQQLLNQAFAHIEQDK